MRFKRLEMVGFKSFAGRTLLDFEPGVTAIVGPNGCGKSNISDAIRWVLGEQSARSLRGSRMEDVIFNGTAEREPIGMAEVSLTMSNVDGVLPIEYTEITVTRQLFRSGESRYLLNRNPCRLRDISELFMNTGLGASEYSIIEQGKMDLVLSSRPEERRTLFEEAAGITKYKARKKEALRKLESTEANLLRIEDILKEVKRQINSIKRQVAKAQMYKEIYAELTRLETEVSLADYKRHVDEIGRLQAESDSIRGEVGTGEAELGRLEESVTSLRHEGVRCEGKIEEVQKERIELQGKIDAARTRLDANRSWMEEISRTSRGTDELEEINRRVSQLEERRREVDEELGAIVGKCDALQRDADELEAALRALDEAVSGTERRIESARGEALEAQSRSSSLTSRVGSVRAKRREVALAKRRASVELEEAASRKRALVRKLGEEEAALEDLRDRLSKLGSEKENFEGERARRAAVYDDARRAALDLEKALSRVSSKAELVREIDAPIAIDEVLSGDGGLVAHVVGALSELIDVEEGYADAVVTALADRYADLVTDGFQSSCEIARALNERGLRKVTLSHVDAGGDPEEGMHKASPPPGARSALDVVRADERVRSLVERLLADVVIVDDMENAISLWADCGGVCDVATREGQFISAGGRIVLGALGRGRGWISEQIGALRSEEALLAEKLAQAEARRMDADLAAAELAKELESLQSELRRLEIELYSNEKDISRLQAEVRHSGEEELALSSRLHELEGEDAALGENERRLGEELEGCKKQQEDLERSIVELQNMLAEKAAEKEARSRQLGDVRLELATLMGSRSNIEVSHREICTALEERKQALSSRIGDVDSTRARVRSLLSENESLAQKLEELEARKVELDDLAARLSAERNGVQSRAESDTKKQRELARMLDGLWERQKDLEVRIAGLRPEAEGILNRVREEYGVDLAQRLPGASAEPEDLDEKRSRVLESKEKLKRMGPVNLGAIDEHDELSARFAFLEEQKNDLTEAKDALNKAILKINQTTKRMFSETFETIRLNFREIYKKLFGGGKADLVLVDESDVLESGIDIVARPPGKKLQSVSLLSGGERAMTAVALLFALFKVRPSPFCVLDEIDAPLDEANIGRFVALLAEFIKDSQFIIITHNKRTIEMADVLYGITMEESGVSRVVSVKFTKEGEKKEAAVESSK